MCAHELIRVIPGLKIIALSAEDTPDRQTRLIEVGLAVGCRVNAQALHLSSVP